MATRLASESHYTRITTPPPRHSTLSLPDLPSSTVKLHCTGQSRHSRASLMDVAVDGALASNAVAAMAVVNGCPRRLPLGGTVHSGSVLLAHTRNCFAIRSKWKDGTMDSTKPPRPEKVPRPFCLKLTRGMC